MTFLPASGPSAASAALRASIAIAALFATACAPSAAEDDGATADDQRFVRGLAAKQDFASPMARVALADGRLTDAEARQLFAEILADIDRELAK